MGKGIKNYVSYELRIYTKYESVADKKLRYEIENAEFKVHH